MRFKRTFTRGCVAWAFVLLTNLSGASQAPRKELTYFWQDKEGIVKTQAELTFELIDEILNEEKPSVAKPSPSRKAALYLMDQILHDTRLDGSQTIGDFLDGRMQGVIADLRRPVTKGIRIYKLYNDGWIIKSPEVTIGWDIYRGPAVKDSGSRMISDSTASMLADACDILFLTHNHADHVDPFVVGEFVSKGKPVIAPDEILPDNPGVTHTRRGKIWKETFKAANGTTLKATIVPGHQDHLQNNIYILTTPGGYTVCSTGDQWLKSDLDMMLNLKGSIPPVDVFIPICWAARLPEFCESFGAKVVLTGHENELGHHSIDHREPYWLSYHKLESLPFPNTLMTWGECFEYESKNTLEQLQ